MEAIKRLAKEYLSKCTACDDCFCEYYCLVNGLKNSRVPQTGCEQKIIDNLSEIYVGETEKRKIKKFDMGLY